jgi:nitrile hydratase
MNGAHDMGGMDGFGPVEIETDEPVFHAEWERRAFALTTAMGFYGLWNIDMSRYSRENRDPLGYLEDSYYERWLYGLEVLLEENGLVSRAEIAARMAELAEGDGS